MKTCILGVGNELWGDDGIGPVVVDKLKSKKWKVPVDLFSIGNDLYRIYEYLGEYRKIVIIDALPPGSELGKLHVINWRTLSTNPNSLLSLHDIDLISLVNQANRLSHTSITILGIETHSITWRAGLSPELNQKLSFIETQVYQFMIEKLSKIKHADYARR